MPTAEKTKQQGKLHCDVCGKEMWFSSLKIRTVKVPRFEFEGSPVWKKYFLCTRQKCRKEYIIHYETLEIQELLQRQQEQRQRLSQMPVKNAAMTRKVLIHNINQRHRLLTQKMTELKQAVEGE